MTARNLAGRGDEARMPGGRGRQDMEQDAMEVRR
jgi:hypothetical protein